MSLLGKGPGVHLITTPPENVSSYPEGHTSYEEPLTAVCGTRVAYRGTQASVTRDFVSCAACREVLGDARRGDVRQNGMIHAAVLITYVAQHKGVVSVVRRADALLSCTDRVLQDAWSTTDERVNCLACLAAERTP